MDKIGLFFSRIGDSIYKTLVVDGRYKLFLQGFGNTIVMSFFAVLIGASIGCVVAVCKYSATRNKHLKPLDVLCNIYINIIRGTPAFLQLIIMYNIILRTSKNAMFVAILTFGINSGAYVAEIIRAGIMSIDRGQFEAGNSLGLSNKQTMRLIIMPQAVKNILPALANEFITLLKETAIAGTIAVTDLTKAATRVGGTTYDYYTPLLLAAGVYLILVLGLSRLLQKFEGRLAKSDNR